MAFSRFRIILLSSFFICLFLCVVLVVNFEEPLNYRYMHQLSKLKFNYMFGSRLQINDTEGKRINDSEKKSGDRGCTTCTGSNFEDKTFEVNCAGKCLTNRACQTITCSSKFQLGYEAAQFSINKEDCSQVLNFWKKELTGCAKIYRDIAASPIQWQTEEDVIKNITELQKCQWHKQELAAEEFRSELKRCCNAVSDCLVTQKNTPVGTELTYEAEPKRKLKITHQIFAIFPKNSSFSSRQYKRCAVIGNGGILTNSSCGAEIDQADFVFRCNLPPVGGQFTQDVGTKTNLVTANPSIIAERYSELHDRRRPFFTNLIVYNDALLLLPAFSYTINTGRSFRALYTLQDFQAKQKVVFFNPVYLNRLAGFWRTRGIQVKRLSTGIMIVSLALELCEEVWIYGFWPFGKDIEGKVMPHHYFDNQLPKPSIHSMPTEFHHLLQMHSKGMIKLQMTHCRANPK